MKTFVIYCQGCYLETYGATEEEMEWGKKRFNAFTMTLSEAQTRIRTVQKFFPLAVIKDSQSKARTK